MIKYLGFLCMFLFILSGCPEPEDENPPQKPPKTPPQTVVDSGQSSPVETPEDSGVDPEESDPVDGGESESILDSGTDPQPPVVDSGVDPQPPIVDSGFDPQPPIVDSGFDPQPPIVDSGFDPQPPVVDSGIDPPPPVVDSGVDPPSPVVDAGDSADAGDGVDWGTLLDSGGAMDSGVDEDAGTVVDAGVIWDAGDVFDAGDTEITCDGGMEWNGTLCADTSAGDVVLTLADVATPDSCVPLTIGIQDKNSEVNVAANVDITLSLALDQLFSDAACETVLTSAPVMLAQQNSITLYWLPSQQTGPVEVSASMPAFSTGYAHIFIHTESYVVDERPQLPLLVYNTNDPDALDIALYYQDVRDVSAERLCGVALPRGNFASPDELMNARDQVVENCFCSLADTGGADCSTVAFPDLLAALPVTHLVLFRGMPGRLTGSDWANDREEPSFDYFFSYTLAHDNYSIFVPSTEEGALEGRLDIDYITSPDRVGEAIDPVLHGYFALGRVEAITPQRTMDLIDRVLDSEAYGFTGNFISEEKPDERPYYNIGRFLTSSFAPECTAYLSHTPFVWESADSSWPYEQCRWGSTGTPNDDIVNETPFIPWQGLMPGENDTTIHKAVNAGWFNGQDRRIRPYWLTTGEDYPENNNSGFRNYKTLKRWKKIGTACEDECVDEACRENSSDYFGVLNTDCVGLAKGFMGQQNTRWPVQFYGFFPSGWKPYNTGDYERTPPRVLTESSNQNGDAGVAEENNFLRFGQASPEALNGDTCGVDSSDDPILCVERVSVNMQSDKITFDPALSFLGTNREIAVRFRYRNQGWADSDIKINLRVENTWVATVSSDTSSLPGFPLDDDHLTWTDAEYIFEVPQDVGDSLSKLVLKFQGLFDQKIRGFFDVDSVEVEFNGNNLLDAEFSEFNEPAPNSNAQGASAADVIDRMGGIAYWGSSSEFATYGITYQPRKVATRLFGGRTLGESLAISEGKSGFIYADPLYRGYVLRIYNEAYKRFDDHETPRYIWTNSPQEESSIFFDVLNGTDHTDSVLWTIAACEAANFSSCDQWEEKIHGQGAVRGYELSYQALNDLLGTGAHLLRLRIWVPDRPEDHLSTYAHIELTGIDFEESPICVGDVNEDGIVDEEDSAIVADNFTCTTDLLATYDINNNGSVGSDDVDGCQVEAAKDCADQDLSYDFDTSNCVEEDPDCELLQANQCNDQSMLGYDVNDDGVVNETDVSDINTYLGYNLCVCAEDAPTCNSAL